MDEILNFPHLSKPASLEHSVPVVSILWGQVWYHRQEQNSEDVAPVITRNIKCSRWKIIHVKQLFSGNEVIPGVTLGRKAAGPA